jgi:hypothetical protein
MSLNLKIAKCVEGAELVLKYDDTDKPMGIVLIMAGPDSNEYRQEERRQAHERLQRAQRGKQITGEQAENWAIDKLTACVLGWKIGPPALAEKATAPEFNQQNVRTLFKEYPEIRDQTNRFLEDRRNFRRSAD